MYCLKPVEPIMKSSLMIKTRKPKNLVGDWDVLSPKGKHLLF